MEEENNDNENYFLVQTNPYARPIKEFCNEIATIKWSFPFFHQGIQVVVSLFVIFIIGILYITVGVASQICGLFWRLTLNAARQAKNSSTIEKSAYVIATGVYLVCFFPFWFVQFPFWLVGWAWEIFGYYTIVIFMALLIFVFIRPDLVMVITDNIESFLTKHMSLGELENSSRFNN
jgi:hypothetical protein